MRAVGAAAVLSLSFLLPGIAEGVDMVQLANGTIQGGKCRGSDSNFFFSIPYGAPPTGDLRFAPPQPHGGWRSAGNGTLNATIPAPSCIQFAGAQGAFAPQSEDCLYLNVFAPSKATPASKLPVKVFVFGGSDVMGAISDSLIDGCYSSADAVVVTFNYRLGPLGWLSLQSAGLTGNYGLQDQMLAMRWVKENIEGFGGDPTKVLLFGQSAGAINVFALATLPEAPSLMKAAVMESGGGMDYPTIAQAERWGQVFLTELKCGASDMACLRSKTADEMVGSVQRMPADKAAPAFTLLNHMGRGAAWGPVVDGKVVTAQPSQAGVKVPSILGANANDGTVFVYSQYPSSRVFNLNPTDWETFLAVNFGGSAGRVDAVLSPFRGTGAAGPGFSPPALAPGAAAAGNGSSNSFATMSSVITENAFRCTAQRAARQAARGGGGVPVYSYLFNQTTACTWVPGIPDDPTTKKALGIMHSAELPYVFGITEGLPRGCSLNEAERRTSAFMVAAWTSMAASGSPGPDWPAFTADAPRVLVLGSADGGPLHEVQTIAPTDECEFFNQLNGEIFRSANQLSPLPTKTPGQVGPGNGDSNNGGGGGAGTTPTGGGNGTGSTTDRPPSPSQAARTTGMAQAIGSCCVSLILATLGVMIWFL